MSTILYGMNLVTGARNGPSPIEGLVTYDIAANPATGAGTTSGFNLVAYAGTSNPLPLLLGTSSGVPISWLSERFADDVTIASDLTLIVKLAGNPVADNAQWHFEIFRFKPRSNELTLLSELYTQAGGEVTLTFPVPQPLSFVRGDRVWFRPTLVPTAGNTFVNVAQPTLSWGTKTTVGFRFVLTFAETFTTLTNTLILYPRRTATHTAGGNFFDLLSTKGALANTTGVRNTAAGGTELQWTRTAGGTVLEWISPRFAEPFYWTSADGTPTKVASIIASANESSTSANCGIRFKLFRRSKLGVESVIWQASSSAELTTAALAYDTPTIAASASYTPTSMYADDRLVLRAYVINIGTMASGFTATVGYDATGVNFPGETKLTVYNIEQFKAEADPDTPDTVPDGTSMLGMGN